MSILKKMQLNRHQWSPFTSLEWLILALITPKQVQRNVLLMNPSNHCLQFCLISFISVPLYQVIFSLIFYKHRHFKITLLFKLFLLNKFNFFHYNFLLYVLSPSLFTRRGRLHSRYQDVLRPCLDVKRFYILILQHFRLFVVNIIQLWTNQDQKIRLAIYN